MGITSWKIIKVVKTLYGVLESCPYWYITYMETVLESSKFVDQKQIPVYYANVMLEN